MIDRLALLLLLAGCLLFGAIVFIELEPVGADDAAITEAGARPVAAPAMRRQQSPRLEELVAAILGRPLFSSMRRPPENAPAGGPGDADLADTRLTGIVTEPGRRIAIFAINGDKPLKLAEGEAVSGWRIESITPREVSLSGPSGTKTLQPKLDPNLAQQAGQPLIANPAGRLPVPPGPQRAPVPAAANGQPNATAPISTPGVPRPARPRPPR